MTRLPLQELTPNEHGDWISVRNEGFAELIPLGDKDNTSGQNIIFYPIISNGVKTNRDAWVYNYKLDCIRVSMQKSIEIYNVTVSSYLLKKDQNVEHTDFVDFANTNITWTREILNDLSKGKAHTFDSKNLRNAQYRPFSKQFLYFSRDWNNAVYQIPKLFPTATTSNLVICVPAPGGNKDMSVLMTNLIPDLHLNGDTQCFPLYYYEPTPSTQADMFSASATGGDGFIRRDGVSDWILAQAQAVYGDTVSKADIFYYVYGFLHSPDYRTTYANDLKKMLPRLPLVAQAADFWAFSRAGRALAELHVDYEQVPAHPQVVMTGAESGFFAVEKMRFPAKDRKDTIIYNSHITISNIPAAAYEYVVNGKSAIEWVMERYAVTTHKESGIVNDPNDWAREVGNPRYILDLLLSVIHVSTQTVAIVAGLPRVVGE